ncbi:FAD-dependent monooxygenase [Nonomuraea sp. CA-143628]|uniref:FAD-dependent monooxygenase n=1 Tax=Nonomuraea sp. CA-143628 TaxID=3239997 RepID=UPI003D905173
MSDLQVLIAGAGPTGLTLACDLARRGVAVRVIDQAPGPFPGSRAKGVTPRTVEVLDDLGLAQEAVRAATPLVMRHYGREGTFTDQRPASYWQTSPAEPHPQLLLPQWRTEAILRSLLGRLGVTVEYATRLARFEQDGEQVTATVQRDAGGQVIVADYLVGCDGGHSTVRKQLGVAFEGATHPGQTLLIGDVEVTGLRPDRLHLWADPERGLLQLCPFAGVTAWQVAVMTPAWQARPPAPSQEVFQRAVLEITGMPQITLGAPTWTSTYRVNVRMADRLRGGRVFLAGDAAHVHPPAGGLGMNTGIQDAYNLGWKLGLVLSGHAGDGLLDTYEGERLPIAAWALGTSTERLRAMTGEFGKGTDADLGVVNTDDTRQLRLGYRWSPLSREGHRQGVRAGDRAPDAPCRDAAGASVRLFDIFRGPHFTLVGFGQSSRSSLDVVGDAWPGPLRTCLIAEAGTLTDADGHAADAYGVTGEAMVLVRPDGHLALTVEAHDTVAVLNYLEALKTLLSGR